jgi:hypothetical protein
MSPIDKSDPTSPGMARGVWTGLKAARGWVVDSLTRRIHALSPEMQAAVVTCITTLVTTVITILLASPEIRGQIFKSNELHVKSMVRYVKLNHFRDGAVDPRPIFRKKVGQMGSSLVAERGVFDEAEYTTSYELKPHNVPFLEFQSHTSGISEGLSVVPPIVEPGPEVEAYEKAGGKILIRQVDLRDEEGRFLEHVVTANRNYNGFQQKADRVHYESDVGMHIRYHTDLATLVVDFSSLDYEGQVAGEPKVYLDPGNGHRRRLESAYENGVLICRMKRPPIGSEIICDWTWSTEKAPPLAQAGTQPAGTSSQRGHGWSCATPSRRGETTAEAADGTPSGTAPRHGVIPGGGSRLPDFVG